MNVFLLDGAKAAASGAQTAQGSAGGGPQGFDFTFLIMLVAMFAIMYFFMIRPQNKRRKELQNFQASLQVGQRVFLAGGFYGTVKEIDQANNIIYVEIAKGVQVQVDRNAIYQAAEQQQQ